MTAVPAAEVCASCILWTAVVAWRWSPGRGGGSMLTERAFAGMTLRERDFIAGFSELSVGCIAAVA